MQLLFYYEKWSCFRSPILILHSISHKVFPHSGSKIEAPAEVHQTALVVAARKLESLTGRMEYLRPVKPGDAAQFLRRNLPLGEAVAEIHPVEAGQYFL